MIRMSSLHLGGSPYELVMFDLRMPSAVRSFHNQRAAWQEDADFEMLDVHHAVLILRPGRARRLLK